MSAKRSLLGMSLYWFKAFHLIAMVAWFAGMFYMFRLFVYHTENVGKKDVVEVLMVMQRRLYKAITLPAMLITLFFGFGMLVLQPEYLDFTWMTLKLLGVAGLVTYTFYLNYVRKRFSRGDVYLTSKQCRFRNEIPTPLLVVIVILASIRPF